MTQHVNEHGQPIGFPIDSWQPCAVPPRTSMKGEHCTLEPFDAKNHGDSLYHAYVKNTDGRHWTYLPYGPFDDPAAFQSWLMKTCLGNDPLFYTIVDASTQQPAGVASYLRISPESGSIEVGHIHYAPALQRTTAATDAMYLMMRRVFDELGYRRYEWKCDALNARSRAAAIRLGFTFEGIFRQATVYKNRNRDSAWYAITDREWPMLKTAYQAWLQPGNFDSEGNQVTTLSQLIEQNQR